VGIVLLAVGVGYVIRFPLADTLRSPEPGRNAAGIAWLSDESEALSRARAGQKPVLIDFYADWCAACRKLEARTFAHPAVIAEARDWVCLKVDGSNPDDRRFKRLQEKYAVVGLPTLVFLTPQGRRLPQSRITAYIGPAPFAEQMQTLRARF
jgi:thiol:disulfide interchange protein DsbD